MTFQFEALHAWPDAPEPVRFLRDSHRHLFHVRAEGDVGHDDRDIEFILLRRDLQAHVAGWGIDLGARSCEMMARGLRDHLVAQYGDRRWTVEVSEDGENGAILA